jgi:hypothetical protein
MVFTTAIPAPACRRDLHVQAATTSARERIDGALPRANIAR